jgi:hypothetical protein
MLSRTRSVVSDSFGGVMKDRIYFNPSTTAADLMARRDAIRAVSNTPGLRFTSNIWIPKPGRRRRCNLLPERSVIEPSPISHKKINEVV